MQLRKLMHQFATAGTTTDVVYQVLRYCITNGMLTPGAKLRGDALAKQMAVSRTPVRDALHRLEAEGLAAMSVRSGLVVTELTDQDFLEVMYVREALEGMAARLAAENGTPSDLARIRDCMREIDAANAQGGDGLRSLLHECFNLIYLASHNNALVRLLTQMQLRTRQFRSVSLFSEPERPAELVAEVRMIAHAVEARDSDLAEQRARDRRRKAMEILVGLMRERRRGLNDAD